MTPEEWLESQRQARDRRELMGTQQYPNQDYGNPDSYRSFPYEGNEDAIGNPMHGLGFTSEPMMAGPMSRGSNVFQISPESVGFTPVGGYGSGGWGGWPSVGPPVASDTGIEHSNLGFASAPQYQNQFVGVGLTPEQQPILNQMNETARQKAIADISSDRTKSSSYMDYLDQGVPPLTATMGTEQRPEVGMSLASHTPDLSYDTYKGAVDWHGGGYKDRGSKDFDNWRVGQAAHQPEVVEAVERPNVAADEIDMDRRMQDAARWGIDTQSGKYDFSSGWPGQDVTAGNKFALPKKDGSLWERFRDDPLKATGDFLISPLSKAIEDDMEYVWNDPNARLFASNEVNPITGRVIDRPEETVTEAQQRFRDASQKSAWEAFKDGFTPRGENWYEGADWSALPSIERWAGIEQESRPGVKAADYNIPYGNIGNVDWEALYSSGYLGDAAQATVDPVGAVLSTVTGYPFWNTAGHVFDKVEEVVEPITGLEIHPWVDEFIERQQIKAQEKFDRIDDTYTGMGKKESHPSSAGLFTTPELEALHNASMYANTTINPNITVEKTIQEARERERVAEEQRVAEQQAYDAQIAQAAAQAQAVAEAARVEQAAQRASTPAGAQDIRSQVDTFTSIAPPAPLPVVEKPTRKKAQKKTKRTTKITRPKSSDRPALKPDYVWVGGRHGEYVDRNNPGMGSVAGPDTWGGGPGGGGGRAGGGGGRFI